MIRIDRESLERLSENTPKRDIDVAAKRRAGEIHGDRIRLTRRDNGAPPTSGKRAVIGPRIHADEEQNATGEDGESNHSARSNPISFAAEVEITIVLLPVFILSVLAVR